MRQRFALHGQCSWVSLLFGKPKAYFWRQHRKNQMNHEARTIIFTEKSSIGFTASCSFPVKVEAIVVEPFKWKRVSLYSSIRLLIEKDLFSLSAAFPRDPFHSLANNCGHQCCKWIFRLILFKGWWTCGREPGFLIHSSLILFSCFSHFYLSLRNKQPRRRGGGESLNTWVTCCYGQYLFSLFFFLSHF